jgi:small subunit ribosomal protein S17
MPRRVETGVVISDKAAKTRRVEIPRLVRHPKYGKYMRRRTICHVHDERNESHSGDLVEIVESRPLSKLKRWELVRVVEKGKMVDLAAMRAAARDQADRPDAAAEGILDQVAGNTPANQASTEQGPQP